MVAKAIVATEAHEMQILAQWLDLHNLVWCHVPRREGCGVPDVLIFNQSPYGFIKKKSIECTAAQHVTSVTFECTAAQHAKSVTFILREPIRFGVRAVGVAIDLKRKGGKTTKAQDEWLHALANCGWYTSVCHGADEAIELLMSLGYGR